MSIKTPVFTLMTDFGLTDSYVAEMKGVLLSHARNAQVVDICHTVQNYNIEQAAWLIHRVYHFFPENTVHIGVVDPGVGSKRKGIVIRAHKQWFVGPDNGLFTLVRQEDKKAKLFEIVQSCKASFTFHGRDVFAPVALHLHDQGIKAKMLKPMETMVEIPDMHAIKNAHHQISGKIVYVDHFGNLQTNIPESYLLPMKKPVLMIGKLKLSLFLNTFSEIPEKKPAVIVNSSGYLEIAVREGSASHLLHVNQGIKIRLYDASKSLV